MTTFTFPPEELHFRIQNCTTPQMLADQLALLCAANHFEYYQLCLTLRRGLQQTDLTLLMQTPDSWAEQYAQGTTIQNDALYQRAQMQSRPLFWQAEARPEHEAFLPMAAWRQVGMEEGIAIPLHGPSGFYGYFALSRHKKAPIRLQDFFHLSYLGHIIQEQAIPLFSQEPSNLSMREKECLFWVSEGKTSWEIAQILGITERTVNFHLNNAIRKSGCKNRYQTVAKNIITGELAHSMTRVSLTNMIQHPQPLSA
jgi:DNA-binding CsgD family transcriptional regulator